ncbi:MAG: ABC transporter substrate-binding protein [Candidatus Binatia bacterium]
MRVTNKGLLLSGLAIFFFSFSAFAKEPEEIWNELAKLPPAERRALLLSKAKEEGEVVWYASMGIDLSTALKEGFEQHHPGVTVKVWRGSGGRLVERILTEARAGKSGVDVIGGGNEDLPALMKSNLAGRYHSPERKFYTDQFKDRDGYWTSYYYMVAVMAYNTATVPEAEAPKKYEDFLNPRWKGSFAIHADPDRALMGWLKMWGAERTERFLDGLMKNGMAVRRGHTLIAQLLCAGEFKAAIELYPYRVPELKQKGCGIDMVFPNPTPGALTPLVIAKQSPHPYGAALLVDYLLSENGQRILGEGGRYSGRPGIKLKYPEMEVEKRGVSLMLLRPEDAEQLSGKYMELTERVLRKR